MLCKLRSWSIVKWTKTCEFVCLIKLTKDNCCIRKRAQNRQEEPTNDPRSKNFKQNLTSIWQQLGPQEHEVTIDKNEKNISKNTGGAWQKSIRLRARIRRKQAVEMKQIWLLKSLDSIGDQIEGRVVACNWSTVGGPS